MTDAAYVQLFKLMVSCYYDCQEPSPSKAPTAMLGALKILGARLRRGKQHQSSPYGTAGGEGGGAAGYCIRSFAEETPLLAKNIVQ